MNVSELFAIQALLPGNPPVTRRKARGFAWIGETQDGCVVRDGQEVGHGRILPLWLFGFLY